MATYARYIYTQDMTAKRVGNEWHKVEREYIGYYPSGRQTVVVINGCAVKARLCEVVQVFEK